MPSARSLPWKPATPRSTTTDLRFFLTQYERTLEGRWRGGMGCRCVQRPPAVFGGSCLGRAGPKIRGPLSGGQDDPGGGLPLLRRGYPRQPLPLLPGGGLSSGPGAALADRCRWVGAAAPGPPFYPRRGQQPRSGAGRRRAGGRGLAGAAWPAYRPPVWFLCVPGDDPDGSGRIPDRPQSGHPLRGTLSGLSKGLPHRGADGHRL